MCVNGAGHVNQGDAMIAVRNGSNEADPEDTGESHSLVDVVCEMMARATTRERRLRVMLSDGGGATQPL
jgi:hypothetical protein